MINRSGVLYTGLALLLCSTVVQAHKLSGGTHQHIWRSSTYGKDYRPGHEVSGSNGSITIWSPTTLNKYGSNNSVRFARPVPFNKKSVKQSSKKVQGQLNVPYSSTSPSNIPRIKSLAPSTYGKIHKRDYGK